MPKAGIQCISCHLSHTQDLRVTSDQLCQTCHRDALQDPLHTAHWLGETPCTSCHVADSSPGTGEQLASSDPAVAVLTAPRHDFVAVSRHNCLDCHAARMSRRWTAPAQTEFVVRNELMQTANQVAIRQSRQTHHQPP